MESNTILIIIALIVGGGAVLTIMEWIAKQFDTSLDELSKSNWGALLTLFVLLPVSVIVGVIGLVVLPLYGLYALGYFLFAHIRDQRERSEHMTNQAIAQQRREEALQLEEQMEAKVQQRYSDAKQAVDKFTHEALAKGQWVFRRFVEDTPISVPTDGRGSIMGCTMDQDFLPFLDTAVDRGLNWEYNNPNLKGALVIPSDQTLVPDTSIWLPLSVTWISGSSYRFQPVDSAPMKFKAAQSVIELSLNAGSDLKLGQKVEFEFSVLGVQSQSLVDGQAVVTYDVQARTLYYVLDATARPSGWQRTPDKDWNAVLNTFPRRARDFFPVYALLFVARPVG